MEESTQHHSVSGKCKPGYYPTKDSTHKGKDKFAHQQATAVHGQQSQNPNLLAFQRQQRKYKARKQSGQGQTGGREIQE